MERNIITSLGMQICGIKYIGFKSVKQNSSLIGWMYI